MSDRDYGFDPAGGELADVARRGAREWERDMAAWESDAEMLRLRQRSLVNVLWEAMQRGDQATIAAAGHTFSGRIEAARQDLAVVVSGEVRVVVNLAAVDAVHLSPGAGGTGGDRTYGSFRAFLGMLEVEGSAVRIIGRKIDVRGRVEVVADDHVLLDALGGGRWAIVLSRIAAVIAGR